MNEKFAKALADALVAQRNQALDTVAYLSAQIKTLSEELDALKAEKTEEAKEAQ